MSSVNWISAIVGLFAAGFILYLVRRDHLHTRYAMWWVPVAIVLALLGLFPQLNDMLGIALGISYPPIIPLLLGVVALVLKILFMDIERSRNEVKLARLVQRVGLLEQRLEEHLKRD